MVQTCLKNKFKFQKSKAMATPLKLCQNVLDELTDFKK